MANNNTIRIRKNTEDSRIYDTISDFGVYVIEEPMLEPTEVKDMGSTDWLDEHGIDVYNAPKSYFKDFDVELTLGIKEVETPDNRIITCHEQYKRFVEYLTTNGILHDMYCPWVQVGRTDVRYKSTSNIEFERVDGMSYMIFKAKFHVADPKTEIAEF